VSALIETGGPAGPYEHTGAYRPAAPAQVEAIGVPMAEPESLWAVVEYTPPEHPDEPQYLVKGPGDYGSPYWYSLDGEDGWGWGQVMSWPGTVRLVRPGVTKDET
jgi:hypothetical protein